MIVHFLGITFWALCIDCGYTTAIIEIKNAPEISGPAWHKVCRRKIRTVKSRRHCSRISKQFAMDITHQLHPMVKISRKSRVPLSKKREPKNESEDLGDVPWRQASPDFFLKSELYLWKPFIFSSGFCSIFCRKVFQHKNLWCKIENFINHWE